MRGRHPFRHSIDETVNANRKGFFLADGAIFICMKRQLILDAFFSLTLLILLKNFFQIEELLSETYFNLLFTFIVQYQFSWQKIHRLYSDRTMNLYIHIRWFSKTQLWFLVECKFNAWNTDDANQFLNCQISTEFHSSDECSFVSFFLKHHFKR